MSDLYINIEHVLISLASSHCANQQPHYIYTSSGLEAQNSLSIIQSTITLSQSSTSNHQDLASHQQHPNLISIQLQS